MTIQGEGKGNNQNQQKSYRLNNYEVLINAQNDKQLSITAIDLVQKIQFNEKEINLEQIGSSTVILALESKRKEVTIEPKYKKQGQLQILELHIKVQSLFLKTIEQVIYLKKVRNISQSQLLSKKVNILSQKLKKIKEESLNNLKGFNYFNCENQEKYYNAATYENLISLKLPKGKYLLTFSFLLKAGNTWLYLYLNQGETIMTNCGYYMPNGTNWIPYTIRKTYTVNEEQKQVSFTTYCANSYPVTLRNRIMVAKPLKD